MRRPGQTMAPGPVPAGRRPTGIEVDVHNGVVTLTGQPELATDENQVQVAMRLDWNVDGVVDVVNKIAPAAVGDAAAHSHPIGHPLFREFVTPFP